VLIIMPATEHWLVWAAPQIQHTCHQRPVCLTTPIPAAGI